MRRLKCPVKFQASILSTDRKSRRSALNSFSHPPRPHRAGRTGQICKGKSGNRVWHGLFADQATRCPSSTATPLKLRYRQAEVAAIVWLTGGAAPETDEPTWGFAVRGLARPTRLRLGPRPFCKVVRESSPREFLPTLKHSSLTRRRL